MRTMFYDRLGQNIGRGHSKNHYYKDCFKLVKTFQRKFIIFYGNLETDLPLTDTQFNKSKQN